MSGALGARLAAVAAAPGGPGVAAVFELGAVAVVPPADALEPWAGRPAEELHEDGRAWYRAAGAAGLRYEGWDLVKAHERRGHTVVLVAAGRRDRVAPIADELGVEHLICPQAEAGADGVLTGRVGAPHGTTAGRVNAALDLARAAGADVAASFAYAGRGADIPLLEAVGHPLAVAPDRELRAAASGRGWPVLEPFAREASTLDGVRTAATYAGFLAAAAGGLTGGLLRGRRRFGADTMTRVFGTLGPALSGVRVNVQGEEHARDNRPAVFLLNHQSSLVDAIVTFHLLREGFTPVAKSQVKEIPLLGPATALAGWAYVDRVGDRAQAVAAISDAVDKLQAGVSVVLAPEGTRSPGPRPGPFKKGAFFMAREAGVPVVPIVIRNAGELMWRSGRALKPGTVDVVVHPPIHCDDWTDAELGERVDEVRDLYVRTLEAWPG